MVNPNLCSECLQFDCSKDKRCLGYEPDRLSCKSGVVRGAHLTGLQFSSYTGHSQCVRTRLVTGEYDPEELQRALRIGVAMGHSDVTSALMEAGADGRRPEENGSTALSICIRNHDSRTLKVLIEAGVSVHYNQTDIRIQDGDTVFNVVCCPPIMLAVYMEAPECVQTLANHGASFNLVGPRHDARWRWLHSKRISGFMASKWEEILQIIWQVEGGLDRHLLGSVFSHHSGPMLQRLLSLNIPLITSRGDPDTDSNWMLNAAIGCQNPDSLSVLLRFKDRYNLDVNKLTRGGPTLLQISCGSCNDPDLVEELLKHGADPDLCSLRGWIKHQTPLFRCILSMSEWNDRAMDILFVLLAHDCLLNVKCPIGIRNQNRCTPFEYSLASRNLYAAHALTLAGARWGPESGQTPLNATVLVPEVVRCSDEELEYFVENQIRVPRALRLLCRDKIRRTLGECPANKICDLPIAPALQKYVGYSDIYQLAAEYRKILTDNTNNYQTIDEPFY